MKICVVGGGAAGMTAAVMCAERGADVILLEKNEKTGKKLFITGKGRCNLTNDCSPAEFLENVVRGEKFMRSVIYAFPPEKTMLFFEGLGLSLVTERGNRVFPSSQKSSDVIKALENALKALNVDVRLRTQVREVRKSDGYFEVITPWESMSCDKLIIATGGLSYPSTGSTGDGYAFAKALGLNVVKPVQGLVQILVKENVSKLQGLALKNVRLTAEDRNGKILCSEFGELMFTAAGLSGPIALTASSYINRAEGIKLSLDLKPALSEETLDNRLLREFGERSNQDLKNVMRALLPERLNSYVLSAAKIQENKKINVVTKEERGKIVNVLKNLRFTFSSLAPFEEAVITSGGVDLKDLKPNMECKNADGLFFIGEVIDADALTGGFNLQIAFATAAKATEAIFKEK